MRKKGKALITSIAVLSIACTACSGTERGTVEKTTEISSSEVVDKTVNEVGIEKTSEIGDVTNSEEITERVVLDISQGKLLGYKTNDVYTFKGIPYATAKRFQNPEPVMAFDGSLHLALAYGTVSPQDRCLNGTGMVNEYEFMSPSNGTADMVANENCQNLNVWSSDLKGKKPVVVFIHGGGLTNGSATELSYYTGEYYSKAHDQVFVSVNHRLNVLGFLDVSEYGGPEYAESANAGMKDCVTALSWVKENIEKFGGDPDNVTLIGQSGGGRKVSTLACMSDAEGLFNKVVCMSPDTYSTYTKKDARENTELLVDYLGLKDEEVLSTLENMSYEELYLAATEAGCTWKTYYGIGTFEEPLFKPETGEMNQYASQRTWMMGNTFGEFQSNGLTMIHSITEEDVLSSITEEETMKRLEARYGEGAQQIADAFTKAYPAHRLCEVLYLNTASDSMLHRLGMIGEEGVLKKFTNANAHIYNYMTAYTIPYFGGVVMHHTGDVPYWFNSVKTIPYQIQGDEKNANSVAETMSSALASFAETGNPSTEKLEWPMYTTEQHNTAVFDVTPEVKIDYDQEIYNLMSEYAISK